MKLTVKTLKGTHFEIRVQPHETIMAVKKNIEEAQGKELCPCGQQLLIHNGKVLKDETTLEENKISEDGFLVVMLSRSKASSSVGAPSAQHSSSSVTQPPAPAQAPQQAPSTLASAARTDRPTAELSTDAYVEAASSLVGGNDIDKVVNQLMEMGGGSWERDTVIRALRAAYNNPERAVDYLYSEIPTSSEIAVPVGGFPASQTSGPRTNTIYTIAQGASPLSGIPNSAPLNMFPQGTSNLGTHAGGRTLEFLRNNPQFQALRQMVQSNPQILQPMLQELSKQNPQLLRLIQDHHAEFLQLINEPTEDVEGDLFDQPEQDEVPHSITVTPEEEEAISRLEAIGFDRARVTEAFLACDRNEQLAANYLLEHAGDED